MYVYFMFASGYMCGMCLFTSGYMVVDPSLEEEQVMEGKLIVGMNIHQEVCVLQMNGGVAILPEQVGGVIESTC